MIEQHYAGVVENWDGRRVPARGSDSSGAPRGGPTADPMANRRRTLVGRFCPANRRKPSVGLEPTTPSLPWKVRTGMNGHMRARMGNFCLQPFTFGVPVHAGAWSPIPIVSCAQVTPPPAATCSRATRIASAAGIRGWPSSSAITPA